MSLDIVVMGQKEVGKKSLVNYLRSGCFRDNYIASKEDMVATLKFEHLGKPLTVNVWNLVDMSKLQRADGIILIYNGKNPKMEQRCRDQNNIRFLHGDSSLPIETCTNKMDLYHYDKLFEEERDLSSIYEGISISVKEGSGLLKLFSNLLRRMEYYPKNLKFPKILFGPKLEIPKTKIEVNEKTLSKSYYINDENGMIGVTHEFLSLEKYLNNYNEIERNVHKSDNNLIFNVTENNPREIHFAHVDSGVVKISSQFYQNRL